MGDMLVRLVRFVSELRRRRIFHVIAGYAAAAFVVMEVTELVVEPLRLPGWTLTLVVLLAILGFPIAAMLAWAFELTPEGVRRTRAFQAGAGEGEGPGALRGAFLVLTVLLTLVVGWGAWTLWVRPPAGTEPVSGPPALDPTRIAVLYFDAFGTEEDLRYFADGLTEGLIDRLARVDALDVKSRTAVKPYRSGEVTHDSIVRALGVGSLVEGSVRQSGGTVRATVQLIDGATGNHLESTELERPWGERLDLSDEIVLAAADMIRRGLGVEVRLREHRGETDDVEAWTLLVRAERMRDEARRLFLEGDSAAATRRVVEADELLARAEREDPSWVAPIVLRGWLAADRAYRAGPTSDTRDAGWSWRAVEEADRALTLRADLPEALELRGAALLRLSLLPETESPEGLRRRAEIDLRSAVGADPTLARAWAELSELYRLEGRLTEAKWAGERALEEDAFLEDAHLVIGGLYQISVDLADFEEAVRWCRHGRERFPERRYFIACSLFNLALAGGPEPAIDRAWELYEEFMARSPAARRAADELTGRYLVGGAIARAATAGTRDSVLADSARRVVAAARRVAEGSLEPWADYYEANVRLLLGEREEALRLVGKHLAALPGRRGNIAADWMFRPLWEDPRFRALVGGPEANAAPSPDRR